MMFAIIITAYTYMSSHSAEMQMDIQEAIQDLISKSFEFLVQSDCITRAKSGALYASLLLTLFKACRSPPPSVILPIP